MPAVSGESHNRGGIRYIEVADGTGAPASRLQCVYAHYTAWLADGTKVESSHDPLPDGSAGEPVAFVLGVGQVMQGWDVGFDGMKVGGRRRLFVPYALAYGERGRPPVIRPRTPMIFDVELMGVASQVRGSAAECPAWKLVKERS